MLAEIFMLRLECTLRAAQEPARAVSPRFVPALRGAVLKFKKSPAQA
jgi:hypothetical protein